MDILRRITLLISVVISVFYTASGQNRHIVKDRVDNKFEELRQVEKKDFKNLFTKVLASEIVEMPQIGGTVIQLNHHLLSAIIEERNEVLSLDIPFENEVLAIKLIKAEMDGINVSLISENGRMEKLSSHGVYYQGYIEGEENSIGAISFTENNIYGMFSSEKHFNLSFTKLDGNKYLLYPDKDFDRSNYAFCGTPDEDLPKGSPEKLKSPQAENNCVQLEWVVSYPLFQEFNSNAGLVEDYVLGIFNNFQVLYANEAINVNLKNLVIYDVEDPFDHSSGSRALNSFRNNYPHGEQGMLYHLLDYSGNDNGGMANINALCNRNNNAAYSDIASYYRDVPDFSWTIMVVTHETGHNLGANHTHWCGWPGGAIDGCAPTYDPGYAEGNCDIGPIPSEGGTMMSYCHLLSVGVNFTQGFGPIPGDLIRNKVYNAACLEPCIDGCINMDSGYSVSAPDTDIAYESDCIKAGEYFSLANCVAGKKYKISSSVETDYLTVRQGSYDGELVLKGFSPLVFTASANGDFYIHVSTDSDCGTDNNCRYLSVECINCTETACDIKYEADYNNNLGNLASGMILASDFPVAADDMLAVDFINFQLMHEVDEIEVSIFRDQGGKPGPIVFSPTVIQPVSQTLIKRTAGNVPIYDVRLDLRTNGLVLPGGENGIMYWLAIQVFNNSGKSYWIYSCEQQNGTYGKLSFGDYTSWIDPMEEYGHPFDGSFSINCPEDESWEQSCCVPGITAELKVTDTSCGENNGSITVTASGGTGYSYEWSANANTGNSRIAFDLAPGMYFVTVTSSDGCEFIDSAEIKSSTDITVTSSVTHATCSYDGKILVTASGGMGYYYEWSTNANTGNSPLANNLAPGIYSVTVTTSDGCSVSLTETVNGPDEIRVTTTIQHETCYEDCDGAINLDIEGGVENYSYSWSTGSSDSASIHDLCPGIYGVTVTDSEDCKTILTMEIIAAEELIASLSATEDEIVVSVSGGTEPYTYAWNTGQTTANIEIDPEIKFYQVTITDANGCEIALEHVISSIAEVNRFPGKIFPNPAADIIYIEAPEGLNNYELTLYDFSGVQLFKTKVHNLKTYSLNLRDFNPGTMIVKIEGNKETYYNKIIKQ